MNKDMLKEIGVTIGVVIILTSFFLMGLNYGVANSPSQEDLETAYTMGAFNVANQAIQNGQIRICDSNNNCITLFTEQYLKSIQQNELPNLSIDPSELND